MVKMYAMGKAFDIYPSKSPLTLTREWNNDEIRVINELTLLSAKPVVYLVNLSEADFVKKKNKWYLF